MLATLASALLLGGPNLAGTWSLNVFGADKKPVMAGKLVLQRAFSKFAPRFTGKKQLTLAKWVKGRGHDKGSIEAVLKGNKVHIDLDLDLYDDNYVLDGVLSGASVTGTWYHATIAGARERGSFTMSRIR